MEDLRNIILSVIMLLVGVVGYFLKRRDDELDKISQVLDEIKDSHAKHFSELELQSKGLELTLFYTKEQLEFTKAQIVKLTLDIDKLEEMKGSNAELLRQLTDDVKRLQAFKDKLRQSLREKLNHHI